MAIGRLIGWCFIRIFLAKTRHFGFGRTLQEVEYLLPFMTTDLEGEGVADDQTKQGTFDHIAIESLNKIVKGPMTKLRWPKTLDYLMKSITIVKKKVFWMAHPPLMRVRRRERESGEGRCPKSLWTAFSHIYPLSFEFIFPLCFVLPRNCKDRSMRY